MPSIVLASAALALAIQAQAAPSLPSGSRPLPGIVETPGGTRLPLRIEIRSGGLTNSTYQGDLREARREIDRRRDNGELTRREARELRGEAQMIDTLAKRYGRNGLSNSELRELDMHAQTLRSQAAVRGAYPTPQHP